MLGLLSPAPLTVVMSNDSPHWISRMLWLRKRKGFVDLKFDVLLVKLTL